MCANILASMKYSSSLISTFTETLNSTQPFLAHNEKFMELRSGLRALELVPVPGTLEAAVIAVWAPRYGAASTALWLCHCPIWKTQSKVWKSDMAQGSICSTFHSSTFLQKCNRSGKTGSLTFWNYICLMAHLF